MPLGSLVRQVITSPRANLYLNVAKMKLLIAPAPDGRTTKNGRPVEGVTTHFQVWKPKNTKP
jgi:hypothetical protein